jgi:hypothetical protein
MEMAVGEAIPQHFGLMDTFKPGAGQSMFLDTL